jgi:putative ABC transport system substrate-binding protein
LENVSREQPDALIVLPAIGTSSPTLIQEFVASHQLPTMFSDRGPVDLGGLMGLGPNYSDLNRRAAQLAIRVLRGAKPGDLPVEQPSLFDFVVNMSAAHALGISIPESVLLQATDILR